MRTVFTTAFVAGVVGVATSASASSFTQLGGPAGAEQSLANIMAGVLGAGYGNGGLLTTNTRAASDSTTATDYSFGGLTAYRIYDAGDSALRMNVAYFDAARDDRGWSDGTVLVETHARYASYSQGFGTTVAGEQVSISGSGYNPSASGSFVFSTGSPFEWARFGTNGPHTSDSAAGSHDNMVAWAILDASGALQSWLLAFDDGGNKNDRDFQDMIVEVSVAAPVPLPTGAGLGMAGLIGVGAMRRRRG
jgi:hypothetical protein